MGQYGRPPLATAGLLVKLQCIICQESTILSNPTCIWGLSYSNSNFAKTFGTRKLESMVYHFSCLRDPKFSHFDTIPACDRQIHTHTLHRHAMTAHTALTQHRMVIASFNSAIAEKPMQHHVAGIARYLPSNYRVSESGDGVTQGSGTIRQLGYDFLFEFYSNCGRSTHRQRDVCL